MENRQSQTQVRDRQGNLVQALRIHPFKTGILDAGGRLVADSVSSMQGFINRRHQVFVVKVHFDHQRRMTVMVKDRIVAQSGRAIHAHCPVSEGSYGSAATPPRRRAIANPTLLRDWLEPQWQNSLSQWRKTAA
ncbi:uncharacterized protein UV8b_04986 [Ustilaginoidea virens]|uniref:Uncharacterized protein n=1 Tax=Ustilaginoidea virens TaxID=1159556 RepID=A0A8E5HSU5_USTVR|nr:uncharacterized protein UV8b_04986 [Ustilaginoidea virens]QUC20745.1 hypothetical protein UV8b_04986 [Ustilaginoidea virens]